MLQRILTVLVTLSISLAGLSQAHNHDHESHEHHRHELGAANSLVYFTQENTFSYGLHMHYTYSIHESAFGLGAGYERIFDEHRHNNIGIHVIYRPVERLNLNLSPGIAFEGGGEGNPKFALHFETSYEFPINNFHLGPSVEFAYDQEDFHISMGIHIGYGFPGHNR